MKRAKISLRMLLVGTGLIAVYLALFSMMNENASFHGKSFSDVETNQLKSLREISINDGPVLELVEISNFSVNDRSTLIDKILLRTRLTYSYDSRFLESSAREVVMHNCKTDFNVGPFKTELQGQGITFSGKLISY